jgi:hypothetical protein
LTLCREDSILGDAGLAGYSASLNRYLYCRKCFVSSEGPAFYALEKPADAPKCVNSSRQLVESFSRLLVKPELADQLPCIQCEETTHCYGPDLRVLARMQPFQFYPFFMMVQRAPTINVLDLIPLLSGASADTVASLLEGGQKPERLKAFNKIRLRISQGSGFLFAADSRQFLEVLFLKLSFLEELLALVEQGGDLAAERMSMEGLWAHMARQGARLPFLWHFDLKTVDPVGRAVKQFAGDDAENAPWRRFLGYAWHYALLVNSTQTMDPILSALGDRLASAGEASGDFDLPAIDDPVFGAHNIFWDAAPLQLPEEWHGHWFKALELGARLLRTAGKDAIDWDNAFHSDLEALKIALRQSLFKGEVPHAASAPKVDHTAADGAIARILGSIMDRYKEEAVAPKPEASASQDPSVEAGQGQPNEDGDYEETVILTDHTLPGSARPSAPPPPVDDDSDRTVVIDPSAKPAPAPELDKTVVINAATAQAPPAERPDPDATVVIRPPGDVAKPPDPDATVVIRPPGNVTKPPDSDATVVIRSSGDAARPPDPDRTVVIAPPSARPPQDDLEKTVVIGQPAPPKAGRDLSPPPLPAAEDDLDKTVVIGPGGVTAEKPDGSAPAIAPQKAGPGKPPSEDDELEATVIVQPKKRTPRR